MLRIKEYRLVSVLFSAERSAVKYYTSKLAYTAEAALGMIDSFCGAILNDENNAGYIQFGPVTLLPVLENVADPAPPPKDPAA